MNIRVAQTDDRDRIVDLFVQLNQETSFLAFEPGECEIQRKAITAMMGANIRQEQSLVLVAESEGVFVGLLFATGSLMARRRRSVHVVIGVLKDFGGKGLGSGLMQGLIEWAEGRRVHRLELTVMKHNNRAIALYKKNGFEVEGTKRDSLCVDGVFVDEYYMARLLPV